MTAEAAPTRARLIAEGKLIDVSETAKEAGFSMPVAMTAAAFDDCVRWSEADTERLRMMQDQAGRLWDVLWTLRVAIGNGPTLIQKLDDTTLIWTFMAVPKGGLRKPVTFKMKAKVRAGDVGLPVLTIMRTTEE